VLNVSQIACLVYERQAIHTPCEISRVQSSMNVLDADILQGVRQDSITPWDHGLKRNLHNRQHQNLRSKRSP
jgi:hypothetical protein